VFFEESDTILQLFTDIETLEIARVIGTTIAGVRLQNNCTGRCVSILHEAFRCAAFAIGRTDDLRV
jgi:hypothetical protein